MKLKYSWILGFLQVALVAVSVVVDRSMDNGMGEGRNQVVANMVSNIEFFFKVEWGRSDIVNFDFNWLTAVLGVVFWFAVGVFIDYVLYRRKS